MKLTRKDFEAIAGILRNEVDYPLTDEGNATAQRITLKLADYLATTNPKFNRGRFLQAAGVENTPAPVLCPVCKAGVSDCASGFGCGAMA